MKILVALSAITTVCVLYTVPAAAQSAYCLRGCDFGYSNCTFTSYQQCQATAAGLNGWCEANPYFHQASDVQRPAHVSYSKRRL